MNAKDIVSQTTGWVIVHPEDSAGPSWVEIDYFSTHHCDGGVEKYRPGCTRVKVRLVPIEDDLTQIHVFSSRDKVSIMHTASDGSVWFPEIAYGGYQPLPKTPREIIGEAHTYVGKCIFTMSEYIILWFLQEIREKRMTPEEVQLFCDGQRIRIDSDGELIDEWPGGFFSERAKLLF